MSDCFVFFITSNLEMYISTSVKIPSTRLDSPDFFQGNNGILDIVNW